MNRAIVGAIVGWATFSVGPADAGQINFDVFPGAVPTTFADGELSVTDYRGLTAYNVPAKFVPSHLSLSFNLGPPATGSLSTGYSFGAGSLTLTGRLTPAGPAVTLVSGQLPGYQLFAPQGNNGVIYYNLGSTPGFQSFTLDPTFAAELGVPTAAAGYIAVAFTESSSGGLVGESINLDVMTNPPASFLANQPTPAPEPASFALWGIVGIASLAAARARRKSAA